VADDLARGRLVPLLAGYRPMEFAINAIYPDRHHLSAKVRRFIDLLAERSLRIESGWFQRDRAQCWRRGR
jgi:DNA-binding transcriptional LysR family regulator